MKRLKYLGGIIIVLSALISVTVWGLYHDPQTDRLLLYQIAIPLECIALAGVLVSFPTRIVRSKALLVIMFLSLLTFGICVYSDCAGHRATLDPASKWLFPFDNALSAFFPSRGDYEIPACDICGRPLHKGFAAYLLFHFLSYFYFAWLGFALFGRKMLSRMVIGFIPRKNKNLIWGYSEGGMELAKDMIAHTDSAEPIFILDDEIEFDSLKEGVLFDKMSDEGIIAFNTRYSNLSTDAEDFRTSYSDAGYWKKMLRRGKYFDGHRHYFITEDQDFNVQKALTVLKQLKLNVKNLTEKTHLFVRTELDGVDVFFQREMTDELKKLVEVHIFNQSDITARLFVKDHPVLDLAEKNNPVTGRNYLTVNHDTLTVDGEINILLCGLGWTGYELMKKLVSDAQYIGDYKVNLVVVDNDYKHLHGHYQYIIREAARFGVNICINPLVWLDNRHTICKQWLKGEHCSKEEGLEERNVHQANSQLFYEWLGFEDPADGIPNILRFGRIIVALGNDELNLNTALQLDHFRLLYLGAREANDPKKMPEAIFAHVRDKEKYEYYEPVNTPSVRIFGGLKSIYNVRNLVDEKMDDIAKLVNYVYSQYQIERLTEEKIMEAVAERNMLESEWSKCSIFDQDSSRATAMHIKNLVTLAGGNAERLSEMVDDTYYIERLSEIEHKRWNAFHYMRGIRAWPMEEVEPVDGKARGKLTYGGRLIRHICLVGYDRLDDATRRVNILGNTGTNFKASDRRIIRHFPIFYKIMNN